ncbi:hypothetical protein ACVWXM_006942 [Bradyrhizobium sp. GM7.3]
MLRRAAPRGQLALVRSGMIRILSGVSTASGVNGPSVGVTIVGWPSVPDAITSHPSPLS